MILLLSITSFILLLSGALAYLMLRPNRSRVSGLLDIECRTLPPRARHNAFTDLVFWKGYFYLVYRTARCHIDLLSKMVLERSKDTEIWETVAEFEIGETDLRDPKLAVFKNRLFLYVIKNRTRIIRNITTLVTSSADGVKWKEWTEVPDNWVFWRPKGYASALYVAATRRNSLETALLRSADGTTWEMVSTIHEGVNHGELALHFSGSGKILGAGRINGKSSTDVLIGSSDSSIVVSSDAPFLSWTVRETDISRLDGPVLFSYNRKVFAVGRFEPESPLNRGDLICRKRTSIFELNRHGLRHLSDLPSGGDTGYAGIVIRPPYLHVSYYTSSVRKDYPWLLGLLGSTRVRIARIELASLMNLVRSGNKDHQSG